MPAEQKGPGPLSARSRYRSPVGIAEPWHSLETGAAPA